MAVVHTQMHEQITDFCQGLDIIIVLAKFSSVDENSTDTRKTWITPLEGWMLTKPNFVYVQGSFLAHLCFQHFLPTERYLLITHFASSESINSRVYITGDFLHLVVFPQKVATTDRSE